MHTIVKLAHTKQPPNTPPFKKACTDAVDKSALLVERMDAVVNMPMAVDMAKMFVTTIISKNALMAAPEHGLDMAELESSTEMQIISGWKLMEWLRKGPPQLSEPYPVVIKVM